MDSALHSDTSTLANGVPNADALSKKFENIEKGERASSPGDRTVLTELDPEDDPKNLPSFRKWLAVIVISSAGLCTACTSSLVCFPYINPRSAIGLMNLDTGNCR